MSRLLRDLDLNTLQFSDSEDIDSPLKELILENYNNWLMAEQTAQSEMISYLKARYLVEWVFTNTQTYSNTATYSGKSLVQYTATEWNENTSYTGSAAYASATAYTIGNTVTYNGYIYTALGSTTGNLPTNVTYWSKGALSNRVLYDGKIYETKAASQGYAPTNTTYWVYVCDDLSLFYVTLNETEWSNLTSYSVDDVVWYNGRNYTALVGNTSVLPDSNTSIWQDDGEYTITATPPTDTTYWTAGDNRNQQIVKYLLDIALYHFLSASPRNMADLRKERYDGNSPEQRGGAIAWLKRVSRGEVFADLPVIIPVTGNSIQYGNSNSVSGVKQDNQIW